MKRNLSNSQIDFFAKKAYRARKVARPLAARGWHHLILKSGRPVLRVNHRVIKKAFRRAQLRFGIELKALAIMENHIHLCVKIPNRTLFAHFLRMFAGEVALKIGGGKIWTQRAWTRVLHARRDLLHTLSYIEGNPVVVGIFDEQDVVRIHRGVLWVPLRP